MKAIILAAGRGSRMGARTADGPKCLTVLAGRTLLSRQWEALTGAGAGEIGIVRGYRADRIDVPGAAYFENPRWEQTNMVQSLRAADDWLKADACIVSYGDIVYSASAARRLMDCPGDIAITYDPNWLALWSARFESPLSDAETFRTADDGRLVEIGGKAANIEQVRGQYMGLLKFTPRGWQTVSNYLATLEPSAVDRLDMTGLLSRLLATGARIDTVPISDRWFEVDSERDLALYETMLGERP